MDLWCGSFKGLDTGAENYKISGGDWKKIGQETTNAVREIPSSYVGVLPDIFRDRQHYTAETWAFWFMYVAPIILKGRFAHEKYYDHMCLLVNIMKTTLKFELTLGEIDKLEDRIIQWVKLYEE